MARRKIVPGPEELERKLFEVLNHVNKPERTRASGAQLQVFAACIAGLSHLMEVDLGPTFYNFVDKFAVTSKKDSNTSVAGAPAPSPTTPKEPLTIPSPGGIFDDLEESDED